MSHPAAHAQKKKKFGKWWQTEAGHVSGVIKSRLDSVLITEAAQVTAGTCGNGEISKSHYSCLLPPSTWKQDVSCYTTHKCNLRRLLELSKVPAAQGKRTRKLIDVCSTEQNLSVLKVIFRVVFFLNKCIINIRFLFFFKFLVGIGCRRLRRNLKKKYCQMSANIRPVWYVLPVFPPSSNFTWLIQENELCGFNSTRSQKWSICCRAAGERINVINYLTFKQCYRERQKKKPQCCLCDLLDVT